MRIHAARWIGTSDHPFFAVARVKRGDYFDLLFNHVSVEYIMYMKGWFLAIYLTWAASFAASGQTPPPNDNFSNSIVLTGTDLTFEGTLAGATLEDPNETSATSGYVYPTPTQSVWWTWTAPVTTTLTLEILSTSLQYPWSEGGDAVIIYSATNGVTSPNGLPLPPLAAKGINFQLAPQTLTIPVTAGTRYAIQLIGCSSGNYAFRLAASDKPVVLWRPLSHTVYSNASALFYVVSGGAGQSTFKFQWRFNGADLPGENAPMLALTNIDGSMAGDYSVVISNRSGFTISEPATLAVSLSNMPVSLSVAGFRSNCLVVSCIGEKGRYYRLLSSTNLVDWGKEYNFPFNPYLPPCTSVFYCGNSPVTITVTNYTIANFFRVTPYVNTDPATEICDNNLNQIRIAKLLWQRDVDAQFASAPDDADLLPYFPHPLALFCPDDPAQYFDCSYSIECLCMVPICDVITIFHHLEVPE
jgi:hypothetical protein